MRQELDPQRVPVIVGVGETSERPEDLATAREPAALMIDALRRAADDSGAVLLPAIDSLDIINEVSWPYHDPVARLCALLGHAPARSAYGVVGGQTPVAAIHHAALRIASGQSAVAAVCGGEAAWTVGRAERTGTILPWPDCDAGHVPIRGAHFQKPAAKRLGISTPTSVYPLYENATAAAWGQSPDQALAESASLWAAMSRVAAEREAAWLRCPLSAKEIRTPGPANRPIAWPYTKLMVANPTVNQGAAVLLTSLGSARAAGIPEHRMVHLLHGAAAAEPDDILERDHYSGSVAMQAVLHSVQRAQEGSGPDLVELYSCFPCVPKMARRVLGLPSDTVPTVTGGLTFFGAALNNYMTHAAVAMVQRLRAQPGATGLLYGQGGYVTKHHALLLASHPAERPLATGDSVQAEAAALRGAPPPFTVQHSGPARLETFTVLFNRDGSPNHGIVIARTDGGARLIARVPAADADTLALLFDLSRSAVGTWGAVTSDGEDLRWRAD